MRIGTLARLIPLLCLVTAACQPLQSTPLPTLTAIHVQYSPAAKPALQALSTCAAKLTGAGIVVTERTAGDIDLNQADLSLRYGLPPTPPAFSAQVGQDQVVPVVNAANHAAIRSEDLAAIFTSQLRDWNDLAPATATPGTQSAPDPIQVWSYSPGDDLRTAFIAGSLGGSEISGRIHFAPDPAAMLQAVSADPAAVGYLPRVLVTAQLRVLDFPNDPSEQVPLLALAPSEPQGAARSLLACLQKPAAP
jgi:ABC-type phosphate transport system substrate-binding protein